MLILNDRRRNGSLRMYLSFQHDGAEEGCYGSDATSSCTCGVESSDSSFTGEGGECRVEEISELTWYGIFLH